MTVNATLAPISYTVFRWAVGLIHQTSGLLAQLMSVTFISPNYLVTDWSSALTDNKTNPRGKVKRVRGGRWLDQCMALVGDTLQKQ